MITLRKPFHSLFASVCRVGVSSLSDTCLNMPFYAVARGITPGIYSTWAECKAQVETFKRPRYKKFATREEAEQFVQEEGNQVVDNRFSGKSDCSKVVASKSFNESSLAEPESGRLSPTLLAMRREMNDLERKFSELKQRFDDYVNSKSSSSSSALRSDSSRSFHTSAATLEVKKRRASSDDEGPESKKLACDAEDSKFTVDSDGYLVVYTDGACISNGRLKARAGVGVYFGPGHPLNVSEPVRGRATNNTAEIQAATYALELAHATGFEKVLINTDSQFVISCVTSWMKSWKKNGWKKKDGTPVINKEDLMDLDKASKGLVVKWNHIQGHMGNRGNEAADELARRGAERYEADS